LLLKQVRLTKDVDARAAKTAGQSARAEKERNLFFSCTPQPAQFKWLPVQSA